MKIKQENMWERYTNELSCLKQGSKLDLNIKKMELPKVLNPQKKEKEEKKNK